VSLRRETGPIKSDPSAGFRQDLQAWMHYGSTQAHPEKQNQGEPMQESILSLFFVLLLLTPSVLGAYYSGKKLRPVASGHRKQHTKHQTPQQP
jgi:hypothetical protein